jgi:cell division protein FtsB
VTAPARATRAPRGAALPTRHRDGGSRRGRSPAVARAYARRAQRSGHPRHRAASTETGRARFVVLIMALLALALTATLWLSTAAAADSYQLESARKTARTLAERAETLGREVASLETAPQLARRARELGMVPAGDAAQLVVRSDGSVVVIGQPRRASAPAPPPAAAPPAPPAAQPGPPAPPPGAPPPQPPPPAPAAQQAAPAGGR